MDERIAAVEAEAALALGRLDGALGISEPKTLEIFAIILVKDALVAALRRSGHAFTDDRFQAWFAGLAPLNDEPAQHAELPRSLCAAILAELGHNDWPELALAARQTRLALLATRDAGGVDAREHASAAIAEAHRLAASVPPPVSLPFAWLGALHLAAGESLIFAPPERAQHMLNDGERRIFFEKPASPAPLWALDLVVGIPMRATGLLCRSLPWMGLVRVDGIRQSDGPAEAKTVRAISLCNTAKALSDKLEQARSIARTTARVAEGQNSTSRAPQLFSWLAAFGSMRTAQIEPVLNAKRLGVRGMLDVLAHANLLATQSLSGVKLYSAIDRGVETTGAREIAEPYNLPPTLIDDFEESMTHIDRLLARISARANGLSPRLRPPVDGAITNQ